MSCLIGHTLQYLVEQLVTNELDKQIPLIENAEASSVPATGAALALEPRARMSEQATNSYL